MLLFPIKYFVQKSYPSRRKEFQRLKTLLHFMDPMLYLLIRKKLLWRRNVMMLRVKALRERFQIFKFQWLKTLLHFMNPMLYLLIRKKLLCRRNVMMLRVKAQRERFQIFMVSLLLKMQNSKIQLIILEVSYKKLKMCKRKSLSQLEKLRIQLKDWKHKHSLEESNWC